MMTRLFAFILLLACLAVQPATAQRRQKSEDAEQLGRAIEYFSSGKYHEALLIFQKLDKAYDLNPRFKAYMGVCYYYEWDYEKSTQYAVVDSLGAYAPHERSFYYYADAESHFNLGHYKQCIPLYEKQLSVCYDNEKGDAWYRIGFCHMFLEDWEKAHEAFQNALSCYEQYRNTPDMKARITQIRKMLPGIKAKL